MNPCRDTFTADPRTKGDEVILTQRWSYETIYPSRVAEPTTISPVQIRSHAQEVKEELRRLPRVQVTRNHAQEVREELRRIRVVEKERTKPIMQPHETPVPERIDTITTTEQISVMKPMDEPMCKT